MSTSNSILHCHSLLCTLLCRHLVHFDNFVVLLDLLNLALIQAEKCHPLDREGGHGGAQKTHQKRKRREVALRLATSRLGPVVQAGD